MPIVIHSREADQKTRDILKEEAAFSDERCSWFPKRVGAGGVLEKDARVLLHCFSGSRELGQQYVKLGATLSVAGPVTYKNNRKTTEVVEAIPIEYLLVETDTPYLTPVPFRGERNDSSHVMDIAKFICDLKGISLEELSKITNENIKRCFDI
jgi:TatD DNase family protein